MTGLLQQLWGGALVRVFGSCLALVVLGCGEQPDGYDAAVRYPVRTDPLVMQVPPTSPTALTPTGRLDENIKTFPERGGKLLDVIKLTPEQRTALTTALDAIFGTPAQPRAELPGAESVALHLKPAELVVGSRHYRRLCAQCHGMAGDGRGPTGPWIVPHPRDFRPGVFKIAVGHVKPRFAELKQIIRRGVPGTAMQPFDLIPEADVDAITGYVIVLSLRGETETRTLNQLLGDDGEPTADIPALVRESASVIMARWQTAQTTTPPRVPPESSEPAAIRRGYELFNGVAGCASCHTDYGRQDQYRYDVWGAVVRVPDLTRGEYHWGREPADLARRVRHGIPGTAMPANPGLNEEQVRDLAAFVRDLPAPPRLPDDVRAKVYP